MKRDTINDLQTIWETLNGALFDIQEGDPRDAEAAIEYCIEQLEAMGVGK